ncbi:DUF1398 domain-containing protein [Streptomyces venezuelae]|uniref:DUF1398 domain-containing protein n=1 Tax=Streptomyces venezuelae TaxID=54571 RepID=A0A5P2DTN3_STRVZ|nr:DUF1398 family protein [Streptomyces venezuelae]QES58552.1 DUF1398 domain-containing protein [Streptomyces venezuelae]
MSNAIENLKAAQERAAAVRPRVGGFPYLAEALRQAGVRTYHCTVPAGTSVYVTDSGPVVTQGEPIVDGTQDIAPWDEEALVKALRTDQAGESTYPEFVSGCWNAGVLHYEVDLKARTCVYHGALGESYTESYPHADI